MLDDHKGDEAKGSSRAAGVSATEEQWLAQVDKALKGAARDTLTGRTEDGGLIAPLYKREATAYPRALRPVRQPWVVSTRLDLPEAESANAQVLEDLEGGANGLVLVQANDLDPRGGGLADLSAKTLNRVLKGVLLDLVSLRLEMTPQGTTGPGDALRAVSAFAREAGLDPSTLSGTLALDAVTASILLSGSGPASEMVADALKGRQDSGLKWPLLSCDGRLWHDQGATDAQELGLACAAILETFRLLEKQNVPSEEWSGLVTLTLSAGADQLATIAKARAARMMWARLLDICDLPPSALILHMETSWAMLTRRDPFVNLLRNTVAGFAAAVGGADSLTVLPHTQALGLPDAFARRLSRNTQAILMEESHLAQVSDPSAGSGALETRTRATIEAAWTILQEVEALGGLAQAGASGALEPHLEKARSERVARLAKGKQPVIGVSAYPNLSEAPVKVLSPAPDLSATPFRRLAAPFEDLRDAADAGGGDGPHVFLAPLGKLSHFSARAAFATNAFAAGGLRCSEPVETPDQNAVIEAFQDSGASLACLVGTDALYTEQGADLMAALKGAGASHVYLAGRPGENAERFQAAGLDTALYAGCDLLSLLREAHARLGLSPVEMEAAQ